MYSNSLKPNATTFNTLIKGMKPAFVHMRSKVTKICLTGDNIGYSRCRCRIRFGMCSCIACFCSDPDEALRLMDEMEHMGLSPERITLNVVIEAFCSSNQFDRAHAIIDQVMRKAHRKKNLYPDVSTYAVLLRGYVSIDVTCSRDFPHSARRFMLRLLFVM